MSRTNPDRFERLALLAGCTTCGVGPDIWCKHITADRYVSDLHTHRGRHLMAAYWQGYEDGKAAG